VKVKITTRWEVRTYDVWGNAEDGYDVNDVYGKGEIELDAEIISEIVREIDGIPTTVYGYGLSDDDIREALDINEGVEIEVDGDDLHYYVRIAEDGYPAGELFCVSHESLSPIREKIEE